MKRVGLLCIIWMGTSVSQPASHLITFFIRPLPGTQKKITEAEVQAKTAEQISTPGRILKSIVKKRLTPLLIYSGIYAAYAGTFTHSNANGQILFERQTPELILHILVTEDVKVVPVNPLNDKTIYGFARDPKAQAAQYLFELTKDPETELYAWNVTPEPLRKKIIAPDTLIIFAQPKNIIVPLGQTVTTPTENLILPDFYATPHNKSAANAFRFLKIRHYFAPVKLDTKFQPDGFQQMILP